MILGDPLFLLLLAPLAALVLRRLRRPTPGVGGGSERLHGGLPATLRARTTWLPGLLGALGALLVVLALARPLQGRVEAQVTSEGIDIMLVIDASSSMLDQGLQPRVTNLEVVKAVVSRFVQARVDDRVGLVSFASWPRTECPLTLDREGLLTRLAAVQCVARNTEEDGTAIGVALGQAARKLKDSDAKSRVIVLLTDGEENRWTIDPAEATALCKDLGIKVYAVAAGRAWVAGRGLFGRSADPTLLQSIASETGGRFFLATDAEALTEVYREIDALERTTRQDVRYTDWEDLYPWLLVPAALLLALELALRRTVHLEFAA